MMVNWQDFKLVLEQNPTISFEYNELANHYHCYFIITQTLYYECLIKKYHPSQEQNPDQIDLETNWLV